ncbi:CxxxxCH/CxxCH domain-containing protein [Melioribacteraceae bacterium 4301-Me]|uniref:CxxxxCH/CxxCH domain c-type cytochrome n=1 Tax=Pyranulibacter aquaticus TaxID=3163344 RepID=UPI003597B217
MKYFKVYPLFALAISIIFVSCSDIKNDITSPPQVSIHGNGFITKGSSNFHANLFMTTNWDLVQCQKCHGNDFSGGLAKVSCKTSGCHTSEEGPAACNTCHGNFDIPNKIAPPRALNGSTSVSDPGVGAHSSHLDNTVLTKKIACNECHLVPSNVFAEGHIDNTPGAEIVFGSLAKNANSNPSFDPSTLKCSNTYCHGNFQFLKANSTLSEGLKNFIYTSDKIEGNNFSPIWNKVDKTQAACGTCHGLPPTGHRQFTINQCSNCHTGVVDNQGKIIDPTRHINGQINVYEEE